MATEDRTRRPTGTVSEWRDTVLSGLALWAVAGLVWVAVPSDHPLQAGVAVGLIYGGLLLPTASYLYLQEVASASNQQVRVPALVGRTKTRVVRLACRATRSRRPTCPCRP